MDDKKTQDGIPIQPGLRVAILEPQAWGGGVLMTGVVVPPVLGRGLSVGVRIEQIIAGDRIATLFRIGEVVAVKCDQLSVTALEGKR